MNITYLSLSPLLFSYFSKNLMLSNLFYDKTINFSNVLLKSNTKVFFYEIYPYNVFKKGYCTNSVVKIKPNHDKGVFYNNENKKYII